MNPRTRVKAMMTRFGIPTRHKPTAGDLPLGEIQDRLQLLEEELEELRQAFIAADKVEVLDALVDLQVVLEGTILACGMGAIFDEAFDRIMDANMLKVTGVNGKRPGMTRDITKPAGWIPPQLEDLVDD